MGKNRGVRLARVFKWFVHRRTRRRTAAHQLLEPSAAPVSKFCRWVRSLRLAARGLCSAKMDTGYIQLGKETVGQPKLPKGHLAVYVGDKEDDTCRVLVPVIYFNHPLFGELLGEAEKAFGFNHPGGIQIPCPISELEKVKMKIAAVSGGRFWRGMRS